MNRTTNLDSLILKLESDFLSGRIEIPYNRNGHIVTCWRFHKCTMKQCPSYGKERVRCWQQSGIFCDPRKTILRIKNKSANCLKCAVFLKSTPIKELRVMEALNNIMFMLDGYYSSSLKTNWMILQNQEQFISNFGLTVREISILPMVLAGKRRAEIAHEADREFDF